MKSLFHWDVSSTHLKSFTGTFCDIVHPFKLYMSQYVRYDYLKYLNIWFLSQFFMYLLLPFTYLWIASHIPPLIPCCTINNISIPVKKSNFVVVFSRLLAVLSWCWKKMSRINHIHFKTYFESFQIYQLTIMRFLNINYDNPLNLLFSNIYKFFLCARNFHR